MLGCVRTIVEGVLDDASDGSNTETKVSKTIKDPSHVDGYGYELSRVSMMLKHTHARAYTCDEHTQHTVSENESATKSAKAFAHSLARLPPSQAIVWLARMRTIR